MFECSEFSIIKRIEVFSMAVKLSGQKSVLTVGFVLLYSVDLVVLFEKSSSLSPCPSFSSQLPILHLVQNRIFFPLILQPWGKGWKKASGLWAAHFRIMKPQRLLKGELLPASMEQSHAPLAAFKNNCMSLPLQELSWANTSHISRKYDILLFY